MHVVYDSIGKETWEEDFEVVRPNATIVTFGNSSGPIPPFAPLKLFPKALKVTRPTLSQFIEEPEDFARYATEIFDIVKKGRSQGESSEERYLSYGPIHHAPGQTLASRSCS